ncbi:hypothetical protein CDD83_5802 [Cordyceps sp. RAO-2017]|nr:hypothetical protein CDD83_5802 [Cordyceps sp. RAO-2017]
MWKMPPSNGQPWWEQFQRPTKTFHQTSYDRIANENGFDGKGKTVFITGGANPVGLSICKAFAEAGVARIAIVQRSIEQLEKAKAELEAGHPSTQVSIYPASVTDHRRMVEILKELGTVDVLILAATAMHGRFKAAEISTEAMQEAFDTNVMATFNLTKAYIQLAPPAAGRKTIINVSTAAAEATRALRIGYGTSKAAAARLMQHFAVEHDKDEVRIISYHPGVFYTPTIAQYAAKDAIEWDDINLPAHFALWLAGPESGFLHGRHVWSNWDVDELIELKDKLAKDADFLTIGLVQQ